MKVGLMVLLVFFYTMMSCEDNDKPTQGGSKPDGLITPTQATNLEANFLSKQAQIQAGSTAYNTDVRDFWFSISELENYIKYAKEEAKKQGKEVNGFRIYLGASPLDTIVQEVGFNTVFVVPTEATASTRDINTGSNSNFTNISPLDFAGGGNPPHVYNQP